MAPAAIGALWLMLLGVRVRSLASGSLRVSTARAHLLQELLQRDAGITGGSKAAGQVAPVSAPASAADTVYKVSNLAALIEEAMVQAMGTLTDYPQYLIMSTTFYAFDASEDDKLSRSEFKAILTYLGLSWDDATINRVMALMDNLNPDQLLQSSEFYFWFTWASPSEEGDLNYLIEVYKQADAAAAAAGLPAPRLSLTKATKKQNTTEQTEWLHIGQSRPAPGQILATFGTVSQYKEIIKCTFYMKMFDFDWSASLDRSEFGYLYAMIDAGASTEEVDTVFSNLDIQTTDNAIQYNEFAFLFTPNFMSLLHAE